MRLFHELLSKVYSRNHIVMIVLIYLGIKKIKTNILK